jgi:hypothetical protein
MHRPRRIALETTFGFALVVIYWCFAFFLLFATPQSQPLEAWVSSTINCGLSMIGQWIDLLVLVALLIVHIFAWCSLPMRRSPDTDDERRFSATALTGTSTAGITAVSILIPASFVIVQIIDPVDQSKLPAGVLLTVFHAAVYFLVSLIAGMLLIFLIPMRANVGNVIVNRGLGILYGFQLFPLIVGVGCLVGGLSRLVFH